MLLQRNISFTALFTADASASWTGRTLTTNFSRNSISLLRVVRDAGLVSGRSARARLGGFNLSDRDFRQAGPEGNDLIQHDHFCTYFTVIGSRVFAFAWGLPISASRPTGA
jgi:hypothetical protein